ncbi:MAG: DUF1178 family protein [Pseudolabrys sp.]|nr:DUF1178 family protein [Pseudolabrys sp.]MBV9262102.1 DUF1178 family protein [Pseudolabrys sp.]
MIKYTLACDNGHQFESWFADSATYDKQAKRKLVACAVCGSTTVSKAIMAPKLAGTKHSRKQKVEAPAPDKVAVISPQERELRTKLKELKEHLIKNADNVGTKFPEEARKMHYGETEHRSIYGEATPQDAKSLIEEGIEVHPLPTLPDEQN